MICRNGDPTVAAELDRVNIREAQTVVAIGSEAPRSDATVASTVLAVGVACGGFSDRTVVAEVDDPAAAETLARACAGEVEVVGDDVIADALAAWMVKPGTAGLVRELLSFEDVRLALCELPASYGRPFASVVGAIEHASPIGIRRSDGTFAFVPAPETVLASGDRLVCLTDGLPPRWIGAPDTTGGPGPPPLASAPMPQRLMVIGWNRLAPGVFRELDRFVSRTTSTRIWPQSPAPTRRSPDPGFSTTRSPSPPSLRRPGRSSSRSRDAEDSSVRLVSADELGLAGEHSFATVAAQTYQHGLLAIGTCSRRGMGFDLQLHARRTDVLRLAPDDNVAALV